MVVFGAQKRTKTGISMLELIIYVGMLSMFMVLLIAVLLRVVSTYGRVRAQREVVSNGRLVIEQVLQLVSGGQAVYGPASVFGSNAGQLSIVTTAESQPEESVNRIDFWLDNGRVWMHKEGSATTSVTSPSVRVNQLRFDQISQSLGREAVMITMQITGVGDAQFTASSTLRATAVLRGTY